MRVELERVLEGVDDVALEALDHRQLRLVAGPQRPDLDVVVDDGGYSVMASRSTIVITVSRCM